jgi:hypothetical protein
LTVVALRGHASQRHVTEEVLMSSRVLVLVASLWSALFPAPARALFHVAHIYEVKSGAGGNPNVQYVEIRMAGGFQNVTGQTRLTAFNCDGTSFSVLLLVPTNVTNEGLDVRWIMASPDGATFLAASGISHDFIWDNSVTGSIPTSCGMVCWGAPGIVPPAPGSWNAADPNQYVDCVAYGPYTGPAKTSVHDGTPTSGTPTALTPSNATFSLQRTTFTGNNSADFTLACPTPENNAGAEGNFGACSPPTTTTTTTSTSTTTLPPPGPSKCTAAKFKEAGKKAAAKASCQSKAAAKGLAVDPACLAKAETKFDAGWTKAEAKGDCVTTADNAAIEAKVDAHIADLVTELTGGNPGPSKCTAAKLKEAGKKASAKSKCYSKAAAKGLAVDPACLAKAETKFNAGWAKAEAKNDCLAPTGDLATIEGKVDAFLADLVSELLP